MFAGFTFAALNMEKVFGERSPLSLSSEIETLKSILYRLADGVIVADRNGKFLFFNQMAESILGIGATDSFPDQDSHKDKYSVRDKEFFRGHFLIS